jgi:hypothetical protein
MLRLPPYWYVYELILFVWQVLGDDSPIVKRLEHDHAGNISALSIEMEETEVFHLTQSMDALKKKLEEAMNSL